MDLTRNIGYYLFASYRRKLIDSFLEENSHLYNGVVLDIGGRDRGKFKSPKDRVKKWIVADIEKSRNPDVVLDVSDMFSIKSESIDVINAIELFEHVEKIEKGLSECFRVLKKDGTVIITAPFLYPIHGDPFDFQRWTEAKWRKELAIIGFKIEKLEIMGKYFTVIADILKKPLDYLPTFFKILYIFFIPIFDIIAKLDTLLTKNKFANSYTTGYLIIAKK
jgi:SAM-dependent methyltransferase